MLENLSKLLLWVPPSIPIIVMAYRALKLNLTVVNNRHLRFPFIPCVTVNEQL